MTLSHLCASLPPRLYSNPEGGAELHSRQTLYGLREAHRLFAYLEAQGKQH